MSRPQRAVLVVLALSDRCEQILRKLALPDLIILPLTLVEQQYLAAGGQGQSQYSRILFYFDTMVDFSALQMVPGTSRPHILIVIFISSILRTLLWQEIGSAPLVLVEHRFSSGYSDKICFGRFNVGWNTFDQLPCSGGTPLVG